MLLGGVHHCDELLVLDVPLIDGGRVKLAPVQDAFVEVAPAQITGGVRLERDNGQLLIFKEDARATQRRRQRVDPLLRVRVPGGVQLSVRCASCLSA